MSLGAAAELTREIADAGRSLVRLAKFDPVWHEGLDLGAGGFVRSFFAPVFALPFYLVFSVLRITEGGAEAIQAPTLWALAFAHLFSVLAFPLLVILVSRPLGFSAGCRPFVIVTNWAVLFFNLGTCALAPLTLLGQTGAVLIAVTAMLLFAVRTFVTWRAARTTLSDDLAPALLMVVLMVAVDLAAYQLGAVVESLLG